MQMARTAYGHAHTPVRSPRQIEYDLFARVTHDLAQADAARAEDHPAFVAALYRNLQFWQVLAGDVATEGNGLPEPLRARLFYLYQFTAEHSRRVLAGEAEAAVMIDINRAVMRGLRGDGEPG